MTTPLALTEHPLPDGALVEASAGTGKTYAVAAYVTLAIASDESLRIGDILVTTYTRNAAAELRDRIRERLVTTARLLRGQPVPGHDPDPLDEALLADEADRVAKARRLERAVAEFDTATIGTIHSICARMLRLAGVQAADAGDEQLLDRVIEEVVNDAVVAEAAADLPRRWLEQPLAELVRARLGDPFIELFDGGGRDADAKAAIDRAIAIVEACVATVHERMRSSPSFDDLLRRAWEAVQGDDAKTVAFREELRRRFRIGIVDEAQDTSRLQWEFLHAIFPPGGAADASPDGDRKKLRHLIAVGDPKQAIYGFRGADVTAYLRFAHGHAASSRRTLTTNYRSDGPLVAGLDRLLSGATFGPGIPYREVTSAPGRESSRLVELRPVELLDVGALSLADAAVRKVHALLTGPVFGSGDGRPFKPGEICVLVRVNAVGARIERVLSDLGIPAVITGTASVMADQMAEDIRVLLEAMERPSSLGRARRAAATVFFGHTLADVGRLDEARLQLIQDRIATLHGLLQRAGFAAVSAEVMGDESLAGRLAAGPEGERHIVDFAHVAELLQEASGGQGCHARRMLELFADLATRDEKGDLVSRRVESDDEAVKIMSVHSAKGLEFPCVVVADTWNPRKTVGRPVAFYRDDVRLLDAGHAVAGVGIANTSEQAILAAIREELSRLIYVAVTRPRHHLCILRPEGWSESLLGTALPGAPATAADVAVEDRAIVAVRSATDLPPARHWMPPADAAGPEATPDIAPLPKRAERTVLRTSFSGITGAATRRKIDPHAADSKGDDEESPGGDDDLSSDDGPADAATPGMATSADAFADSAVDPAVVQSFTIAELPAGKAFGNVVHGILEHFEPPLEPERAAVAEVIHAVVTERASSRLVAPHHESLSALLTDAVLTPFGGPALFAERRFVDFPATARLPEMDFEMAVAGIARGVLASDVGRVLLAKNMLPADDPLRAYAERIAGTAFDVPLAGLINGTIDAVLRLPDRPADDPRLVIADYKTNRLHDRDDPCPLAAYAPARLTAAMAHGDYPLQALVYGTAVYRMLRWRLGPRKPAGWDAGECIAGVVYAFVRGMKGPDTPVDAEGRRYGVFTWQPPAGIWRRLSDLLAGDREGLSDD